MLSIVETLLKNIQVKKEPENKQSYYPLHQGNRSSRFFVPSRDYPFIVTFLYGVINLKVKNKLCSCNSALIRIHKFV
jgi:hypothetical protein